MGESRKLGQLSGTELKEIKYGRKSQNKVVEITQYASIKISGKGLNSPVGK